MSGGSARYQFKDGELEMVLALGALGGFVYGAFEDTISNLSFFRNDTPAKSHNDTPAKSHNYTLPNSKSI